MVSKLWEAIGDEKWAVAADILSSSPEAAAIKDQSTGKQAVERRNEEGRKQSRAASDNQERRGGHWWEDTGRLWLLAVDYRLGLSPRSLECIAADLWG